MTSKSSRPSVRDLTARVRGRIAGPPEAEDPDGSGRSLTDRVAALEAAVQENRKLNQRLSDVIDVVVEVLVPAADRDDARMREALDRLTSVLDDGPRDQLQLTSLVRWRTTQNVRNCR